MFVYLSEHDDTPKDALAPCTGQQIACSEGLAGFNHVSQSLGLSLWATDGDPRRHLLAVHAELWP